MDRFLIILLIILVILVALLISNLRNNNNLDGNNLDNVYCDFSSIFGRGEDPLSDESENNDTSASIDANNNSEFDDFDPLYGAFEGIKDEKLNDYMYDQFQKYIEETDHKNIEKYLKKLYKKPVSISDEVKEKKLKYPKIYEYINKLITKTDAKSPAEFLELVPVDYSKFLDTKTAKLLSLKKTIANVDKKVEELIIKLDKDSKLTSEQRNKLIDKLSGVAQKHRKFKLPIKKVSIKALKLMPLDIDILAFNEIAQSAVIKMLEQEKKQSNDYDSTVYWWSLPWWKRPIYYYYWTDYEKLFNDSETLKNLAEIKQLLKNNVSNPVSNLGSIPSSTGYAPAPAPTSTGYALAPARPSEPINYQSLPPDRSPGIGPDRGPYENSYSPAKSYTIAPPENNRYDAASSPLENPIEPKQNELIEREPIEPQPIEMGKIKKLKKDVKFNQSKKDDIFLAESNIETVPLKLEELEELV